MSALAGKTVLLTRAVDDNAAWAERLAHAGAIPVVLPCIATETIADAATRAALAAALTAADWLVFTSRRGVEAFAALTAEPLDTTVRIAVVGPATAAAATQLLGRVDLTSEAATAAALAHTLAERVARGTRVVLAVAENAGDVFEHTLAPTGAVLTRIDVYRTVPQAPAETKRALSSLGADNVLLASPSAVTGFLNQVDVDCDAAVFTIGPTTTAAARAAGLRVAAQATMPSLDGLMEAMTCAS